MEELAKYYDLSECVDRKEVVKNLKHLKKEGKIDYELKIDTLRIEDLDLCDDEISDLLDLFENNSIFEDRDISDDYEDDDYLDDYYDEESTDY